MTTRADVPGAATTTLKVDERLWLTRRLLEVLLADPTVVRVTTDAVFIDCARHGLARREVTMRDAVEHASKHAHADDVDKVRTLRGRLRGEEGE